MGMNDKSIDKTIKIAVIASQMPSRGITAIRENTGEQKVMKTPHSINLMSVKERCFAMDEGICDAMTIKQKHCGTWKCPFYKPEGCKEWIRLEDEYGINLIPPEEANWGRVMTEYTIKTSLEEAKAITDGRQNFVFRDGKGVINDGDIIGFRVVENGKTINNHPIEVMKFRVTCVTKNAPIEEGFAAIGFQRVV